MAEENKILLKHLKTKQINFDSVKAILTDKYKTKNSHIETVLLLISLISEYKLISESKKETAKIKKGYLRLLKKKLLNYAYDLPGNEKEKFLDLIIKIFKVIGTLVAIVVGVLGILKAFEIM